VPRVLLPEVVPAAGFVGRLDFGVGQLLPLHALLVDQQAALFGFAVGVVGGLFAMLLAGAVSQLVAPVLWQPAPAGGGYGGVSLSPVPVPVPGSGTDVPVDPTTPYINRHPSAPAPASAAGPYPYTSEYDAVPPPPPGHEQADPTIALPTSPGDQGDQGDPTTVVPVVPVVPEQVEWAPPPPSAASPSWSRPEDPTRHD